MNSKCPDTLEMFSEEVTPDFQDQAKAYARDVSKKPISEGFKPIALHIYTDTNGLPLYWKIRLKHPDTGDKWIRSFSLNGQGSFHLKEPDFKTVYPDGEGKKPLYRLHEITSNQDQLVFIVEGEQKADALAKLGLIATTSGGKSSSTTTDWQPLAGRNVRMWRDYDAAGIEYQDAVISVLNAIGCNVSIVDVDALGLPNKGDVMDWLAMRHEQGFSSIADDVLALPLVDSVIVTDKVTSQSDAETVQQDHVEAPEIDDELTEDEINQAIEELAALSDLQYQRVRKNEALRLGVSVTFLDKEIKRIRSGNDDSKQGRSITFLCDTVEPHADPVDACELFDFIESQIVASYAVADPIYRHYVTLWGVATWFIDAFRAVPYLNITAPLKNSGKSNLLDVVASFTYKPLIVSDISGSALFRIIEMQSPTLLIDEVDELLRNADNSGLTGLLNDGYRVTGKVIRCVGDNHEPRQFNVFGFKALCGIGQLSKSTTASRCVKVSVRPMAQGETVNDILHISDDLVNEINAKLKRLQIDYFDAVKGYNGQHVTHLLNRDRQIWSSIYAVASLGGTKWIDRIKCAERFINDSRIETLDDKVQLLTDIKQAFEALRVDKIHTTVLIEHLTDNPDSLWSTWHQNKPIDAKHLALLLSDFGIASKDIRSGQLVRKGYSLDSFSVAFKTYLSASSSHPLDSAATTLQPNDSKAFSRKSAATNDKVLPQEKSLQPLQGNGCSVVAAKIGGCGEKEMLPRNATDNSSNPTPTRGEI